MSDEAKEKSALELAAEAVSSKFDADVIFYLGPLVEPQDRLMIQRCREGERQRQNAYLVIVTYGGSPHAAYRIGRCLQRSYKKVYACVPGPCASAGTLLVLAAHHLAMSDSGWLGPLDIQIRKADELFEMTSGLTVSEAVETLRSEAKAMFEQILLDLKTGSGGQITLKTALDTAAKLTTGMFEPLFAQIDPMRLGEDGRSTRIIDEYGSRLLEKSKSLRSGALQKLVVGYPSHQFEIDHEEARDKLFSNVRDLDVTEKGLIESLGELAHVPPSEPTVFRIAAPQPSSEEVANGRKNSTADPKRKRAKAGKANKNPPRGNDGKNGAPTNRSVTQAPAN